MKRTLTGVMAAAMVLGSLAPVAFGTEPARPIKRSMTVDGTRLTGEPPRRMWTCKKCGEKFRPGWSRAICNDCIRERDGT